MPLNLMQREPLLSTITYNLSLLIPTGGYIPTVLYLHYMRSKLPKAELWAPA
jgi:hypothetical protein